MRNCPKHISKWWVVGREFAQASVLHTACILCKLDLRYIGFGKHVPFLTTLSNKESTSLAILLMPMSKLLPRVEPEVLLYWLTKVHPQRTNSWKHAREDNMIRVSELLLWAILWDNILSSVQKCIWLRKVPEKLSKLLSAIWRGSHCMLEGQMEIEEHPRSQEGRQHFTSRK